MQHTFDYMIQGTLHCQSIIDTPFPPINLALFCGACGEAWGRIFCQRPATQWQVVCIPCSRHTPNHPHVHGWEIPGTLCHAMRVKKADLPPILWPLAIECLPEPLVRRELNLILNHLEKTSEQTAVNIASA